jgi:polyisoprenyl-phosphate glycosyltransferase
MNIIDLSIVIPVYNNRDSIAELMQRIEAVCDGMAFECIAVVDASPDDSLAILEKLQETKHYLKLITLPTNIGQAGALLRGLRLASGNKIVIMDADLQDEPEDIPALLAEFTAVSMVFAGKGGAYEGSIRRRQGVLFRQIQTILTGYPSNIGGYVILDNKAKSFLLDFPKPWALVSSMLACSGLPCGVVPVSRKSRPTGCSSYSDWHRAKTAMSTLAKIVRYKLFNIK